MYTHAQRSATPTRKAISSSKMTSSILAARFQCTSRLRGRFSSSGENRSSWKFFADGYFEYSAVATNKSLTVQRLWYFAAGRGGQEKTFAELRSQFALDVVPTKSYAANSAWQQLNVLAHNLCRSFQLDTIAETKGISRKRTCTHLLHTIRTIRFRIINKAGRLVRVSGRNAPRMATNSSTQTLFERIELALAS